MIIKYFGPIGGNDVKEKGFNDEKNPVSEWIDAF